MPFPSLLCSLSCIFSAMSYVYKKMYGFICLILLDIAKAFSEEYHPCQIYIAPLADSGFYPSFPLEVLCLFPYFCPIRIFLHSRKGEVFEISAT